MVQVLKTVLVEETNNQKGLLINILTKLKIQSEQYRNVLINILIYIGEGAIPQIEAAANKYVYSNKPNLPLFNKIMSDLADKAQNDTGNKLTILAWAA